MNKSYRQGLRGGQQLCVHVRMVNCAAVSSLIVVICRSQPSYMVCPLGWHNCSLYDLRRTTVREVESETKRENEGERLKAGYRAVASWVSFAKNAVGC